VAGYKKSRIREAILGVLKQTREHPPADRVWAEVKKLYPTVTLATVYRNLHILESQGRLLSLDVGQGEKRYDGFVHHHAHFVCQRCGEVYDCEIERGRVLPWASVPGEVTSFQLTLYGICDRCRQAVGVARPTHVASPHGHHERHDEDDHTPLKGEKDKNKEERYD